jgi:hypothetical protein
VLLGSEGVLCRCCCAHARNGKLTANDWWRGDYSNTFPMLHSTQLLTLKTKARAHVPMCLSFTSLPPQQLTSLLPRGKRARAMMEALGWLSSTCWSPAEPTSCVSCSCEAVTCVSLPGTAPAAAAAIELEAAAGAGPAAASACGGSTCRQEGCRHGDVNSIFHMHRSILALC